MNKWINKIHCGDALKVLKVMPAGLADMVMTSPPYWRMRSNETAPQIWTGSAGCCNHDFKMREYRNPNASGDTRKSIVRNNIKRTTDFRIKEGKCRKCGAWFGELGQEPKVELYVNHLCDIFDEVKRVLKAAGSCWVNIGDTYDADRGLACVPDKFKIEMKNRGWYCRNEIIWKKNNVMPFSGGNRFTINYEKLYFFTVQKTKYYFKQQYEPYENPKDVEYRKKLRAGKNYNQKAPYKNNFPYRWYWTKKNRRYEIKDEGRNMRAVWEINTKPYTGDHDSTYPLELCIIPIKACGPEGCTVLDPFSGAGTTCLAAKKLGRKYIGIELNPKSKKESERRIHNEAGLL